MGKKKKQGDDLEGLSPMQQRLEMERREAESADEDGDGEGLELPPWLQFLEVPRQYILRFWRHPITRRVWGWLKKFWSWIVWLWGWLVWFWNLIRSAYRWTVAKKWRKIVVFGGLLLIFSTSGILYTVHRIAASKVEEYEEIKGRMQDAYADSEFALAKRLIRKMLQNELCPFLEKNKLWTLMGISQAKLAALEMNPQRRREESIVAVRLLENSEELGFEEIYAAEAYYWLGISHWHLEHYDIAKNHLKHFIKMCVDKANEPDDIYDSETRKHIQLIRDSYSEIYESKKRDALFHIADSLMYSPNPDYQEALEYNQRFLDIVKKLADAIFPQAMGAFQRATIYMLDKQFDKALDTLDEEDVDYHYDSREALLRAQIFIAKGNTRKFGSNPPPVILGDEEGMETKKEKAAVKSAYAPDDGVTPRSMTRWRSNNPEALYARAAEILHDELGLDNYNAGNDLQINYLLAMVAEGRGRWRNAKVRYAEIIAASPTDTVGKNIAQSAVLRHAIMAKRLGEEDEAMEGVFRVLKDLKRPGFFRNPWMPNTYLREQIGHIYIYLVGRKDYKSASRMLSYYPKLFSRKERIQEMIKLETEQVFEIEHRAENQPIEIEKAEMAVAREHWRNIGKWRKVQCRQMDTSPLYYLEVWECATAFFHGQDYINAAEMFNEFLRVELMINQPTAHLRLGECFLAQGEIKRALQEFDHCVVLYPNSPVSYTARLRKGEALYKLHEKERYLESEDVLLDILYCNTISDRSPVWRDALFLLASNYYYQGDYEKAVQHFTEALRRYPDVIQSIKSGYLLAQACLNLVRIRDKALRSDPLAPENKRHEFEMNGLVEKAMAACLQTRDRIERKQQGIGLTNEERTMLRNIVFMLGSLSYVKNDYQKAIDDLYIAIGRYEAGEKKLRAYDLIISAQRALGKEREAMITIAQAELFLKNLSEAEVKKSGLTRREWQAMFSAMRVPE